MKHREDEATPEWREAVQATFKTYRSASLEEQEYFCEQLKNEWGEVAEAELRKLFFSPTIQPVVESKATRLADKYIGRDGGAPPTPKEKTYEYYTVEADLIKSQEENAKLKAELEAAKGSKALRVETQSPPEEPSQLPSLPSVSDKSKLVRVVPKTSLTTLKSIGFELDDRPPWKVSKTFANARHAIQLQGYVCSYNEFLGRNLVLDAQGVEQQLSDEIVISIRQEILDEFGFDPGKHNVYDAMESLCLIGRVNPVVNWLDSLEWDGEPRLDTWLIDYAGAEDTLLNRAFARKSLCALSRRAKQHGCKFDYVIVLEGEEGIRKSSLIKAVVSGPGPEYFSDETILDKPPKEQQELTKGKWGFELSELSGLSRAESEKVKGFLSRQIDEARPAYGRYRVEQLRSCVFFGTTNELDGYLMSQTGNRRWWPVLCNADCDAFASLDVEGFIANRDQLFAEAVLLEPQEDLFINPDLYLDLRALQESRRQKHPWEDALVSAVGPDAISLRHLERVKNGAVLGQPAWVSAEWRVHTNYIFEEILEIPKGSLNNAHAKQLPLIMRRLGWTKADGNLRIADKVRPGYIFRLPAIEDKSQKGK